MFGNTTALDRDLMLRFLLEVATPDMKIALMAELPGAFNRMIGANMLTVVGTDNAMTAGPERVENEAIGFDTRSAKEREK